MKKLFSAAIAAGLALATAAHAAMVITVTEVDGNVVMTGSGFVVDEGRLDIDGSDSRYNAGYNEFSSYSENYAYSLDDPSDIMIGSSDVYGAVVTSLESVNLEHEGDNYGHYTTTDGGTTRIFIDGEYETGDELEFTWIFRDITVEDLGTIFGTVFETEYNSLVLMDGRPVPVPGALPLFLGVIGAGAVWRKKQR